MSAKNNPSATQIFKSTVQVHLAICVLTAIVVGILYTLKSQAGEIASSEIGLNTFELLVPVLSLLSGFGAYFMGKQKLKKIKDGDNLVSKLTTYRSNNILLWVALQGSSFFAAITFYATGRTNLLLYALMLAVLLVYFRPLKTRAAEDLNLSPDEIDKLDESN
jgi:hypothetical protein